MGRLESAALLLIAAALIGRSSIMNRPLHLQCRSVVVEASIRMIWKEIITVALEAGDLGVEALEVVFNASVNATNDAYDDDEEDALAPLCHLLRTRGASTDLLFALKELLFNASNSLGLYAEFQVKVPPGTNCLVKVEEIGNNLQIRKHLLSYKSSGKGPLIRDRT